MESKSNGQTLRIAKTKVALESYKAYQEGKRFIVNQGGTRSGKTYSIIQLLIGLAFKEKIHISIVSHAYPHLRKGAIRDFMEIMDKANIYDPDSHSLTESTYYLPNGSMIEFFSADQSAKVRGPGRDIMFVNEANLLNQDTFRQLNVRTRKTVFMDYNPADEFHWIYDEILPKKETAFIQSTYLDNPFITQEQKDAIEDLKIDHVFWQVYGLGERGSTQDTIYHKFDLYDSIDPYLDHCYGLDFGFTHPTALAKVTKDDNRMYFEQIIYQSHLATNELIEMIKPIVGNKEVYCDSARPEIISDLISNGINAYPTKKFEGSVKDGIDWIRQHHIFVHRDSVDLQKEFRSYKWKRKATGEALDEPVKAFDDLLDACRYGAISFKNNFSEPYFSVN